MGLASRERDSRSRGLVAPHSAAAPDTPLRAAQVNRWRYTAHVSPFIRDLMMPKSLCAVACALLLTCWFAASTSAQDSARTPHTYEVSVDGFSMRAQAFGLSLRVPGEAIVVFESGATNPLEIWGLVAPQVATLAPVVTYDRAGLGQSTWDGQVPTPEHVASRLSALLREIGASPPYVLVGYSWGAVLARYFAGLNPDAVAGLIYVEPGPIVTQTHVEELKPFEEIGTGRVGYDALWSGLGRLMQQAPEPIKAEFEVFSGLMRLAPAERRLLRVPAVPSVVILAGKHQPLPDVLQLPYEQEAYFEADLRHRTQLLAEWALSSPSGTLVVSRAFSHAVPMEDPELIVWAVRRILDSMQDQQ